MALSVVNMAKLPLYDQPHVLTADFVSNSNSCLPFSIMDFYKSLHCYTVNGLELDVLTSKK